MLFTQPVISTPPLLFTQRINGVTTTSLPRAQRHSAKITPSFPRIYTLSFPGKSHRHSAKGGNPVTSLPSADLAVLSTRDCPAPSILSSIMSCRLFPISEIISSCKVTWIPAFARMKLLWVYSTFVRQLCGYAFSGRIKKPKAAFEKAAFVQNL